MLETAAVGVELVRRADRNVVRVDQDDWIVVSTSSVAISPPTCP